MALNGKCDKRLELVDVKMPFDVKVSVVPAPKHWKDAGISKKLSEDAVPASKGGEGLIRRLFEPLGYVVTLESHALDPNFPEWSASKYFTVAEGQSTAQRLVVTPLRPNSSHRQRQTLVLSYLCISFRNKTLG